MQPHKILSRDEWLAARKAHLKNEKALGACPIRDASIRGGYRTNTCISGMACTLASAFT